LELLYRQSGLNRQSKRITVRCPRVTFTEPEVEAVGMTETMARDRIVAVPTSVASFPSSGRG
jgi:pyruvate/2-oxoglutarate dehydrogenase complex dihydrolipoamide dehydrogenase (E3) component